VDPGEETKQRKSRWNEAEGDEIFIDTGNHILLTYLYIYNEVVGLYRNTTTFLRNIFVSPGQGECANTFLGPQEIHRVMGLEYGTSTIPALSFLLPISLPLLWLPDPRRQYVRAPRFSIQPGIVIPPLCLIMSDKEI